MNRQSFNGLFTFGPLAGLVLVYAFFALNPNMSPAFTELYNFKTIATQTVIVGIGALGMTLVIVSGGIDLSVGSQVALCTVVVASAMRACAPESGEVGLLMSWLCGLCGVLACAGVGLITGLLVTALRIVPFIVTLGLMMAARGLAKGLADNQMVLAPDNALMGMMDVQPEAAWMFFSPGVWIFLALLLALFVLLRYTLFGRYVFAIGSNEQTARLCGINVSLRRILIYVSCGVFTGVAGVMQFSNLGQGDPTAAVGMELDIIAAVIIGGGSLSGGEGSAFGTFVGALIMAVLRNGCNILGVDNYVQEIIIGVIIVGAVAIDRLKHRMD